MRIVMGIPVVDSYYSHFLYLLFTVLPLAVPSISAADSCMETAQTQRELNGCALAMFKKTDQELNAVYQKILTEYADDQEFIAKLKTAQRAWLKFRDAEMDALFPCKDISLCYGSIHPMCVNIWLEILTKDRIKQLGKWTETIEARPICEESVKDRNNAASP